MMYRRRPYYRRRWIAPRPFVMRPFMMRRRLWWGRPGLGCFPFVGLAGFLLLFLLLIALR